MQLFRGLRRLGVEGGESPDHQGGRWGRTTLTRTGHGRARGAAAGGQLPAGGAARRRRSATGPGRPRRQAQRRSTLAPSRTTIRTTREAPVLVMTGYPFRRAHRGSPADLRRSSGSRRAPRLARFSGLPGRWGCPSSVHTIAASVTAALARRLATAGSRPGIARFRSGCAPGWRGSCRAWTHASVDARTSETTQLLDGEDPLARARAKGRTCTARAPDDGAALLEDFEAEYAGAGRPRSRSLPARVLPLDGRHRSCHSS